MKLFFFLNEYRRCSFWEVSLEMYMFCIGLINKQMYCFERKNWIASKPKRWCFLFATSSGKRIRESQNVMLILVITQSYYREVSIEKQPPEVFCKKGVFKNFANFRGKHLCWSRFWKKQPLEVFCRKVVLKIFQGKHFVGVSLIKFVKTCKICDIFKSTYFEEHLQTTASVLNKIAGPKVSNFIKKRLQHRCFLVKFAKFLRTPISKNIYERLLLSIDLFPKGCIFCETLLYCIRLG